MNHARWLLLVTVDRSKGREEVGFDYAVLTTGSRCVASSIKAEVPTELERRRQIVEATGRIKRARRIVVAGGGPVGVETAAELSEAYPHLEVTLLHGVPKLPETGHSKFVKWAAAQLRRPASKSREVLRRLRERLRCGPS